MDTLPTTLIGRLIDWQLVTQIKSHFTHFTFRSKQIYFQNKSSAWALILNELIQMNSLRVRDPVDLLVDGRWRCWDGRWRCWDPANTGPLKPLLTSLPIVFRDFYFILFFSLISLLISLLVYLTAYYVPVFKYADACEAPWQVCRKAPYK